MSGTEQLNIATFDSSSGARILTVRGPLTLQTLFEFQDAVRQEKTKPIVLDLAGVAYMDSAGLGSVIGSYTSCQRTDRGFAIAGASTRIRTLFQVAHVDTFLPCYDTLEAAENSLRSSAG